MGKLPGILSSGTLVRFQDCDPYGHLNNSKYLDYFMNAREDQLLQYYDLDIYALIKTEGIAWVVAQNKIAYFLPAFLMEKLTITSRIISFNARKITVEFTMRKTGEERLKALMWSDFSFFDLRTNKSRDHDEKYRSMYEEVCTPIQEASFDERVTSIRSAGLVLRDP